MDIRAEAWAMDEKSGGGYDLSEIQEAREVINGKTGDEKGFENVEPMYITVIPDSVVVRTEEHKERSVIIEYDEWDQVVGVELL